MTDVSKVHGPVGPQDSPMRKDRSAPDPDKFKKMHLIEEVKHTDPDEQKKRKRPEEAEEEESNKRLVASSSEMQDESGPLEQESFLETFSTNPETTTQPTSTTPSSATPRPFDLVAPESTSLPEEQSRPQPISPVSEVDTSITTDSTGTSSSPTDPSSQAQQPQQPVTVSDQELQKQIDLGKHNIVAPTPPPPKKETGAPSSPIEEIEQKKPEKTALTPQELGQEMQEQDKGHKEETPEELAIAALAPGGKESRKKDEETNPIDPSTVQATGMETPMLFLPEAPPPESLPSYTTLSPHVMELFDRMVGAMTVMTASDMTETVITLNAPQFASSVFFGSQIIIQEFTSAPKQFNVKLNGSPQAVALFQGNTDDLMAAFRGGKYGFKINRLETGLVEEKPLFKRKEQTSGDNQDQTGAGPQ